MSVTEHMCNIIFKVSSMCEVNFVDFSLPLESDIDSDYFDNSGSSHSDETAEFCSYTSDTESEGDDKLDLHTEIDNDSINNERHSGGTCFDRSVYSHSNETAEFSSYSSDTEIEGDVQFEWHTENYNDLIDKKHWDIYCANKCFTEIIVIVDRCRENPQPIGSYLVIQYKHDLKRKAYVKRYCYEQKETNVTDKYYSQIFYSPTQTFVPWPGEYISPPDHNILSPFYCVRDWKKQTSASLKEERYYTLFALKEHYHKLFTPRTQVKFFC